MNSRMIAYLFIAFVIFMTYEAAVLISRIA